LQRDGAAPRKERISRLAKAIGLGWVFLFFDQGDFVVGAGERVVGNFSIKHHLKRFEMNATSVLLTPPILLWVRKPLFDLHHLETIETALYLNFTSGEGLDLSQLDFLFKNHGTSQ